MSHTWDPALYLTYADERGRPFVDLLARVRAERPTTVVDLGCGPGNLTRLLVERWPDARVTGVDSSPAMVGRALEQADGDGQRLRFEVGDLRDWRPATAVDVLVSNATLQWVPGHLDLLENLVAAVRPGGWLAFQVPGNFDAPSHVAIRDVGAMDLYREHVRDAARPASHDPAVYLERLAALGCDVDAWETTYLHVLPGEDPVFTWTSGTGARPALEALPDDLRPGFEAELKARLREVYPPQPFGTVLPFRRIFVVARTAGGAAAPTAPA